jgi:hypothetical protein
MSMPEMKVNWKEMVCLFNTMIMDGKRTVDIWSDLLDVRLMSFDLQKCQVINIIEKASIDERLSAIGNSLDDRLQKELPEWSDLRDAFRISLISPPKNQLDLVNRINNIISDNRKKKGYHKDVCLALDTNIAYNRLLSHLIFHSRSLGLLDENLSGTSIVVPNLVKLELSQNFPKFRADEIDALVRSLNANQQRTRSVRRWNGCGKKKARKAKNAFSELTALRSAKDVHVFNTGSGIWSEDNEVRDLQIIESLGQMAKDQSKDVVLFSIDKDVEARSEPYHIEGFTIEYYPDLERSFKADYWMMGDLLYQTGLLFGALSIKGTGIKLFSDWAGKTMDESRDDLGLLEFDGGSISMEVQSNLILCREISEAVRKC